MSTATRSLAAQLVLPGAELALGYTDALVKGISDEQFAHMPKADINSPAFNIGHLAIYGDRICAMLGREDLVTPMPFSADLFKAGAPCVDQPGLYPSKSVLVETFVARQRNAIVAFEGAGDDRLLAENPAEGRFKELFPTVGSACAFLLAGHVTMHLGQISVWRRVMGLGSAM